ncbi:type II toxin-antitoxin system RelE family toxin [aff. Roholtiella sp. LEGE 12411]|uniref:type II toxin-antitoxin system RelE family toxin n=1 Tax=aff. Roholtiella sp. LEGE 12411 TaxID=1828822 RepID=UPI00187E41D3|nr:hypothetical protein [aff. Roholtiella sp. LEGE 12411]MBE9035428.1 hypothetical protein [aff. Roholtiella sp. LEGE 12411]
MSYCVEFTKEATTDLEALTSTIQERIIAKVSTIPVYLGTAVVLAANKITIYTIK